MNSRQVWVGLNCLSEVCNDSRQIPFTVQLVRHCLVQRIVKAYERYNETVGAGRQLSLKLSESPSETAAENGAAAATPVTWARNSGSMASISA